MTWTSSRHWKRSCLVAATTRAHNLATSARLSAMGAVGTVASEKWPPHILHRSLVQLTLELRQKIPIILSERGLGIYMCNGIDPIGRRCGQKAWYSCWINCQSPCGQAASTVSNAQCSSEGESCMLPGNRTSLVASRQYDVPPAGQRSRRGLIKAADDIPTETPSRAQATMIVRSAAFRFRLTFHLRIIVPTKCGNRSQSQLSI